MHRLGRYFKENTVSSGCRMSRHPEVPWCATDNSLREEAGVRQVDLDTRCGIRSTVGAYAGGISRRV
jgi:hypothetical protein